MAGSRTLKLSILADVDNLKKNLDAGSKEVEGFGGKLEKFGKVAAAAFAAAAAAALAYAGKLAIDGVKAAIEDEAAQQRLANALKNVTNATDAQIAALEDQITQMSLAFGVADDQLRPAYQRLATATGDLEQSEKALQLALDISAATGKDVEAVANALAKAYEGNTGALGRLGIGLSNAEIKSLGLDGTMKKLAETFGGAATTQANTLEGQIDRLRIRFDETKESVGAGLLPIITQFIDYVTNRLIPMLLKAKDDALEPIRKAFKDNENEMRALWKFGKEYLVPFFEYTLVNAIKNVGRAVSTIIEIIGAVIRGIETVINRAIDGINVLIRAWNALPDFLRPGGRVNEISNVNFNPNTQTSGRISTSTGSINIPTPFAGDTGSQPSFSAGNAGGVVGGGGGGGGGAGASATAAAKSAAESAKQIADVISKADWMPSFGGSVANWRATESGDVINVPATIAAGSKFDPARFRMGESNVTVVVQAPSIIDEEGFSRAIQNALNEAENRGTVGGSGIRLSPSII